MASWLNRKSVPRRHAQREEKKKLRLKKTCYGCRAMGCDSLGIPVCSLGYQTGYKARKGFPSEPVPLEVCPKPRTYREWFDAVAKSETSTSDDEK